MLAPISTHLRSFCVLATCAALLSACALPASLTTPVPLDSPMANSLVVQQAKEGRMRPLAVGDFTPIEGKDDAVAETTYLRDTLLVDLQGASLLDPASTSVITGQLVHTQMDKGYATVAARFIVTQQGGRVLYERELRASSTWVPALGTVGARWAAKEQSEVYQKLVGQLFSDPGFRVALRR